MEENNPDTQTVETATKVILHAGNARAFVNKAIDVMEAGAFHDPKIEEFLKMADAEIVAAHVTQTAVIQREARGEPVAFSMLMTHAQDSLMTAMSELHMTRRMIRLVRAVAKAR